MITVLKNAELFAPEPLGRRTLVLGGGRVLWIGADEPRIAPELVEEAVDLDGARVIPGLVDLHAHVTGGGGERGAETRVPAPALSTYTSAGVTSVVGLLGTDAETRSLAELLAGVRALRAEGLSAWCWTGGYHLPPCTLTGGVRGDLVHVDAVVGAGELALSDFRSSQPTLDELLRIAADVQVGAMLAGKPGALHLHLGDGERGLALVRAALDQSELPPRLFHPTHVNRRRALFDEACELSGRGCTVDVTAFPVGPDEAGEREELWAHEAVARYLDADLDPARLTVSSDAGGCLPTFDSSGRMTSMDVGRCASLADALARLFASGREPASFLPAFTRNPARLLGLAGKGELARGADADLVVLDSGGRPRGVMAGGRWHRKDGEALVLGTFEPPRSPATIPPGDARNQR